MTCRYCESVAIYKDADGDGVCFEHRARAVASLLRETAKRDRLGTEFLRARWRDNAAVMYERRKARGASLARPGAELEVGQVRRER